MATIVFLQTDRWCLLNCAGNLLAMQSALEGLAFLAGFSPICLSTHFQLLRALLCYLQSICDGNFFFTVYLSVVSNDSSLSVGSRQTQPSSRRAAHSISQQNYWPQTIASLSSCLCSVHLSWCNPWPCEFAKYWRASASGASTSWPGKINLDSPIKYIYTLFNKFASEETFLNGNYCSVNLSS